MGQMTNTAAVVVGAEATLPSGATARVPALRRHPEVPAYLEDTYRWAYLHPLGIRLLDRESVVAAILWGHHGALRDSVLAEIRPGQSVLQCASVYGDFLPALARRVGPAGKLTVVDVARRQAALARHKLRAFTQATVRRGDAAQPNGDTYDVVCCYFLLHELPDAYKRAVVNAALASLAPGGKTVFVDYHRPHPAHPLRWPLRLMFALLEPFAPSLWRHPVAAFASAAADFVWRTETAFGGLYQKTTATRRS